MKLSKIKSLPSDIIQLIKEYTDEYAKYLIEKKLYQILQEIKIMHFNIYLIYKPYCLSSISEFLHLKNELKEYINDFFYSILNKSKYKHSKFLLQQHHIKKCIYCSRIIGIDFNDIGDKYCEHMYASYSNYIKIKGTCNKDCKLFKKYTQIVPFLLSIKFYRGRNIQPSESRDINKRQFQYLLAYMRTPKKKMKYCLESPYYNLSSSANNDDWGSFE